MSNVRQLSFSGGEVCPAIYGRVDLAKYAAGLKTCKNFFVMRHGGASNRAGTEFVAEVKDSTKKVKLVPFIFNASQTYALELGNSYMRVHKAGAQLTEAAKTITGATQANPCVITATAHGYSNGNEVSIASVGGMTQLNGRNFKVANVTANTFSLQYMDGSAVNSTAFGAYTSGGTASKVYEIAAPYLEAALPTIQYVQSADIITMVHPTYAVRELSRTGDIAWSFASVTFGATIAAPTGLASSSPGVAYYYEVTAISATTNEESLPSAAAGSTGATFTLTWNAVSGAGQYNVYRLLNGAYGWIGVAGDTSFVDVTYTPDFRDSPPVDRQPFNASNKYPSAVAYYQQRLLFANTNTDTEGVWTSKSALRKNFMVSTPLQDDDAVTFSMIGKQVNSIKHMLDIGKLIIFTASGEWSVDGNAAGILTPTGINPRQYTANGSGDIPPLVVGGTALYVQARGSVVRDLAYEWETQGYRGNEVSIFSAHLFEGHTIVDWAYQQIPHSIIWAVRDDGVLLGLTYVREHQVLAWHQHVTDGLVENVCTIPEGSEDVLYLVVKRTIGGVAKRYIERMKTRVVSDIVDSIFMDCSLSYDGRNAAATTMTLSGGTTWAYDENLTLTASASFFTAANIGNGIFITGADGTVIRCSINAYTSATVVTVKPSKTVPVAMRSVAFTVWSKAVGAVGGLWHLEGKDVSILTDGSVAANPNNSAYVVKTVTNGAVTLDDVHAVIHVGLPYTSDLETLNIDSVQGQSLADKKKNITRLTAIVEKTRGLWAGPDADNLTELKIRNSELYDEPIDLATGAVDLNITSTWTQSGGILIRQIDPLPISVLSIIPSGYIGV